MIDTAYAPAATGTAIPSGRIIPDPLTGDDVHVIFDALPLVNAPAGWDGITDGKVVHRAAWAAAGYPCQHCGILGGH